MSNYDYEYECEAVDSCWIHENELPDLDHAKNMLQSVLNAVYETGDIESLEDSLDELAGCLNLKMTKGRPVLEKKATNILDSWKLFNQETNENILEATQ
jgi:hypothetical protein